MGRLVQVLAAVELNYETSFKTYEVADIDAKGMLPPELEAIELATTQMAPQEALGIRLVLAQFAS